MPFFVQRLAFWIILFLDKIRLIRNFALEIGNNIY